MLHKEVSQVQEHIFTYLKGLGIPVHENIDTERLLTAFVHKSYAADYKQDYGHNERLEFLGDGVLGAIINKQLFLDYPQMPESEMTLYKIALVREETLADAARDIKLGEKVFISHGEEKMGGRDKDSILSDTFEAIIGAVFLDFGLEVAEEFVLKYVYSKMDQIDTAPVKSYKTMVQEHVQKKHKVIPEYKDFEHKVSSSNNVEEYRTEIYVQGEKKAEGFGASKKKAQEDAAKNFYQQYVE